jgi:hypothetical protein
MPTIQVSHEHAGTIRDAHWRWSQSLPRAPGQIGSNIDELVEGLGAYAPGTSQPYSDFDPVRFFNVEQPFLDFLISEGIFFDQID